VSDTADLRVGTFLDEWAAWVRDLHVPAASALLSLADDVILARDLAVDAADLALAAPAAAAAASASASEGVESGLGPLAGGARPVPDAAIATPDLLGQAYEALLSLTHRHAHGIYYTPAQITFELIELVLGSTGSRGRVSTICDPAVGGGAFMLAAGRALEARGIDRTTIVERCLWGVDVDPLAVAVTASALRLWQAQTGDAAPSSGTIVAGDTLRGGRDLWPHAPEAGFDIVIGNPPFQSQMGRATARSPDERATLRARLGPAVHRYADTATLFMLASMALAAPGGRVALVMPQSFLVADDAFAVRQAILERGMLEQLWIAGESVFAASVRVCAPVIRVQAPGAGPGDGTVRRTRGRSFEAMDPYAVTRVELQRSPTWAAVAADAFGVPAVNLEGDDNDTLASFCAATAGFRDQFYGLRPFVREATVDEADRLAGRQQSGDRPTEILALMTCGLIEPGRHLWGRRPTRFAGSAWRAPVVDLAGLRAADPTLAAWTHDRLVPKVVVATQTRVLEAAVDERGVWFPSVPTIAVTAAPDRLWAAAAVVLAPAVSAWALARHGGAALSPDALKVSARQLLAVPLPSNQLAWHRSTEPLRAAAAATDEPSWRGAMEEFGTLMGQAYGRDQAVLAWWLDRLPSWRS
jgi:hypothetical protein